MERIFIQLMRIALICGALAALSLPSEARAAAILAVPFTSQAPHGNWASPWKDYCEEASVVMAAHFIWGVPLTPQIADLEMSIIRQFEIAAFGRWRDTAIGETADVLRRLYGFSGITTALVGSADDIKRELSMGKIVIAPTAGRMLKNPYFTPPGPLYHMVVIRGFDAEKREFIVNDPGTRRGEGLRYAEGILFNAIHDWNGGDVMRGEKRVMVVGR